MFAPIRKAQPNLKPVLGVLLILAIAALIVTL